MGHGEEQQDHKGTAQPQNLRGQGPCAAEVHRGGDGRTEPATVPASLQAAGDRNPGTGSTGEG